MGVACHFSNLDPAGVLLTLPEIERLALLADEPDNRILECAREGRAEFIVTGDRHLLELGSCEHTTIIYLAAFLDGTE